METKRFELGDVLTITTGRLTTIRHIEGVYDILNWMTSDNLYTHQLPRASRECEPWLLRWFPELAGAKQPLETAIEAGGNVVDWLDAVRAACPTIQDAYDVPRIPRDDHDVIDPVQEAIDIIGPDKVIVIESHDNRP
jgi:hypothetical protein